MRVVLAAVSLLVLGSASSARAESRPVMVFLDRGGQVGAGESGDVEIPRFGGGDRAWSAVVRCVQDQFSPFRLEIVDRRPSGADFITAVVGGSASMLGLDDSTTNGVGPYDGSLLRSAVVNVFSQVGTGERDIQNLCAVTAHEVGHALGLDHEYRCGDVMSYFLDQCGPRSFVDEEAPCGEDEPRGCGNGEQTQNSYRQLAQTLGLRHAESVDPQPDTRTLDDPYVDSGITTTDPWSAGDETLDPPEPYQDDIRFVAAEREGPRPRCGDRQHTAATVHRRARQMKPVRSHKAVTTRPRQRQDRKRRASLGR